MKLLGLLGYPLGHSFSKKYFSKKFENEGLMDEWKYELFPIESIGQLSDLITEHPTLVGLNVTIPHKESVMYWLDMVDETAKEIGAVNCIQIKDGQLKGYNTDYYGFKKALLQLLNISSDNSLFDIRSPEIINASIVEGKEHWDDMRALILGTGGSSKAVAYVLKELGIPYQYVSRHISAHGLTYSDLNEAVIRSHRLIINTTPLGMSPNIDDSPPIPYQYIDSQHFIYDLVYNPTETLFMKKGMEKGASAKGGLDMLYFQAEKGWAIWNENL